MDNPMMYNSINTDRELAIILGYFSDDTIVSAIDEALMHKYRPFANNMPNLVATINVNFRDIKSRATDNLDEINQKELEVYNLIIDRLCQVYNLSINTPDIPTDKVYPLAYMMYQIFVSEFTERALMFFSNYIMFNKDMLISSIPDDKKIDHKTPYGKKMFFDPVIVQVYENMDTIIDIIAGLDLPMYNLIEQLSDRETANFITSFVADTGDLFKHHYAVYIYGQVTRTDMITAIKLRFLQLAGVEQSMLTTPPIIENQ